MANSRGWGVGNLPPRQREISLTTGEIEREKEEKGREGKEKQGREKEKKEGRKNGRGGGRRKKRKKGGKRKRKERTERIIEGRKREGGVKGIVEIVKGNRGGRKGQRRKRREVKRWGKGGGDRKGKDVTRSYYNWKCV